MNKENLLNNGFISCGFLSDGNELLKRKLIKNNGEGYEYYIADKDGNIKENSNIINDEIINLLKK